MTPAEVLRLLDEKQITITHDGRRFHLDPPDAAPELWPELKRFKPTFFEMLAQWPVECLLSELELGKPSGRLHPLLGNRVKSPTGPGDLLLLGEGVAVVQVDGEPRPQMFRIFQIWPTEEEVH